MRGTRESVFKEVKDGLSSFFKLFPLLQADSRTPGLDVLLMHLSLPNDDRGLDAVLEVKNIVFRRQID